ncbi:MAG: hypothetical protein RLN85_06450, partial [Pseudomonadales bacterium]
MKTARFNQIRALIETTGSRFISVEFRKKDGTLRRMLVNPAKLPAEMRADNGNKSESHVRGAQTRKAQNPNLLNVWDHHKDAPRSINLATLDRIRIDGVEYRLT